MGIILALISLAIIGIGAMMIYKPDSVLGTVKLYADEIGLQVAASVGRILLGVAFMVYASHSNLPGLLWFLGLLAVITGIVFFVMKPEQFSGLIRKVLVEYADYAKVVGGVVVVLGLVLLYAVS